MAAFGSTRRHLLAAAIGTLPAARVAGALAQPAAAASDVVVRILDCSGSFQLMVRALDAFRQSSGSHVAPFFLRETPAAKMPELIRPESGSGRSPFDLVFAGADALVDGIDRGLWLDLLPQYADRLPDLEKVLSKPALQMQGLAKGRGVVTAFSPMGPLFNYVPARVPQVPRSMAELLDWARAHPMRLTYPMPNLTAAGAAFLMGLPYLLSDSDAKDPEHGWPKTWSYLQELGNSIRSYAVSPRASFNEMREGTLDICVSSLPDDLGSRMSTASDPRSALIDMQDLHWVGAAYYAAIPATVAPSTVPILLDLISYLLTTPAQALAFGRGTLYPGPAIAGMSLAQAAVASRDLLAPAERPVYARLIADHPVETPLAPAAHRYAVRRWLSQIAAAKS